MLVREAGGHVFLNVEQDPRRETPDGVLALLGFVGLCMLAILVDAAVARAGYRGWFGVLLRARSISLMLLASSRSAAAAWCLVSVCTACSAWLVWREAGVARRRHYAALRLWGWQLLINSLWAPLFFAGRVPLAALAMLLAGMALAGLSALRSAKLIPAAGWLMLPLLGVLAYAAALNLMMIGS